MVSVKILGSGCANCTRLESVVAKVIAERGIDATIEKVTDYARMIILRRVLKPRLIATFTGIVALGIIAIGYVFNLAI